MKKILFWRYSMFCPYCGASIDAGSTFCPSCGRAISNSQQPQQPQPQQPDLPMKWYMFLIYFALFAGAVINLINGFTMMTGAAYGEMADLVYSYYDGLKALDMIIGIASIALAVLGIYTRFRLSGYYQNGPQMLLIVYIAGAVINIGYLVGMYAILPSDITAAISPVSYITSTITSCVMIGVNNVYFQKRSHLFTK